MKRLLALLLLLPLAAWGTDKINIAVPALLTGDAAISRQPLTLTPTSPLPRTYYTNVFSRQPISRATDANGLVTFSNIVWGYYRLDIPGNPGTSFGLVVGTNLTGTVNVVTLITNTAGVPPNPSTNYLTEAQSDARYATIGSGGGGGSATNVFFISGQNTTAAQIGGSNTFHVTGLLTNSTLGNAATATDADFATEATRAHGLLDLDSLDAVTTTLTKVVINSGHELVGHGGSLSNVPSKFVASIDALTNSPGASNLIVYVDGYFPTNFFSGSGGTFKWENSSATIDNGIVFAASGGGRYRRINTGYPTNVVFMEWFGLVQNAAIDQYTAAQSAINATPTVEGKCILPPFNFATANTLTWTNRRGSYLGTLEIGKVRSSGYRVFPNPTCVIHWMGVNGGTNMVAYDSGHNTFAGFGLDTRIGLNNGDQWTNAAGLLMDVDMYPTHSTTTSANVFDGIYFRERGTNTTLVGQRIASYNWQNCEFFRWYDCYWQGGGWNLPQYWVQTTNLGALKAVQLGGNGGGANSFQHYMFNCGWDRWMYNIHSSGGNWVLDNPKSTAAGAAAFYLNGDHPSIIRFADCEGDRQFLISPGDTVQLVGNRIADAVQAGYTNLPPIDAVKLLAYGNYLQHEAYIPAITNSFNATGSYDGAGNSFDTTNDALIASWRFNSAFNSRGDFGTLKEHNNIQSGPWKTPSATQETNVVYGKFTDGTASTMALTLMPSNGVLGVGSYLNNVHFGVYNPDLNKASMQFGDSVINPRFKLLPSSSGLITELQLFGSNSVWMELYSGTGSSATRLDFVGSSAVNKIHARTGSLKITGTNDTDLLTFGTDYKIKFPYNTNVEFVGPIQANSVWVTNFFTLFTNDNQAGISTAPTRYGQMTHFGSNGVEHVKVATTSGTLAWASTNVVPLTAAQVVGKFSGTPTGSLFLRDDGTLAAPSVGGVAWGAISGTLSSQTDLATALADTTNTTRLATQLGGSFDPLGRATETTNTARLTTQLANSFLSKDFTGYPDTYLFYNNAGGLDLLPQDTFDFAGTATAATNTTRLATQLGGSFDPLGRATETTNTARLVTQIAGGFGVITTNNNTLLGGSFVLTGDGARGVTNLAVGAGLLVENGVLKTNGQTTGGGSSSPIWSTSWASSGRNAANNSPAYYLPAGTANSGSELLSFRIPAPFAGYVTNLWANLLAGSGAVQAGTNCGVTLFTNGVASNFHGEMLGDGTRTIINVTNVGLYVKAGTLMSLQASNNSASAVSFTFNGTLQIVP